MTIYYNNTDRYHVCNNLFVSETTEMANDDNTGDDNNDDGENNGENKNDNDNQDDGNQTYYNQDICTIYQNKFIHTISEDLTRTKYLKYCRDRIISFITCVGCNISIRYSINRNHLYVLRTCRTTLLFNYCTSNYNCTFKNSDNNDSTSVDAASATGVRKINDNS